VLTVGLNAQVLLSIDTVGRSVDFIGASRLGTGDVFAITHDALYRLRGDTLTYTRSLDKAAMRRAHLISTGRVTAVQFKGHDRLLLFGERKSLELALPDSMGLVEQVAEVKDYFCVYTEESGIFLTRGDTLSRLKVRGLKGRRVDAVTAVDETIHLATSAGIMRLSLVSHRKKEIYKMVRLGSRFRRAPKRITHALLTDGQRIFALGRELWEWDGRRWRKRHLAECNGALPSMTCGSLIGDELWMAGGDVILAYDITKGESYPLRSFYRAGVRLPSSEGRLQIQRVYYDDRGTLYAMTASSGILAVDLSKVDRNWNCHMVRVLVDNSGSMLGKNDKDSVNYLLTIQDQIQVLNDKGLPMAIMRSSDTTVARSPVDAQWILHTTPSKVPKFVQRINQLLDTDVDSLMCEGEQNLVVFLRDGTKRKLARGDRKQLKGLIERLEHCNCDLRVAVISRQQSGGFFAFWPRWTGRDKRTYGYGGSGYYRYLCKRLSKAGCGVCELVPFVL
jgi:hypothetical protein